MSTTVKNILKLLLTAVFIITCGIIPSFINSPNMDTVNTPGPNNESSVANTNLITDYSDKVLMYLDYGNQNEYKRRLTEEDIGKNNVDKCNKLQQYLYENLFVDQAPEIATNYLGSEILSIADGSGNYIRVIEYFWGGSGDWQNWIDVVIDADTQDIYYLYISCQNLINFSQYTRDQLPDSDSLLQMFQGWDGGSAITDKNILTAYGIDPGNDTISYIKPDGRIVSFDIVSGYTIYEDSTEYGIYDYKIYASPISITEYTDTKNTY